MTSGIHTGWQHATWALGYLLGALPVAILVVALVGVLVWLTLIASVDIPHHIRVRRIRRQARRDGRDPNPQGFIVGVAE